MLIIVDDFTRFKQVFTLKAKSQAGERILTWMGEMEAKHDRQVRA
jgi:poly(A) polymerase Pap1